MTLQWMAIFLGGVLVGASIVGVLVCQRRIEPLALVVGIAGVVLGTWGVIETIDTFNEIRSALGAVVLSLASLGGGYALASSLLPYVRTRESISHLPELVTSSTSRWGVIVLACVEPERYTPAAITAELDQLLVAGLPPTTLGVTPFLYASQKARYRAMGDRSPAIGQAKQLVERVSESLGDSVFGVRLVTCVGRNTLAEAIARYSSQGVTKLAVATLAIADGFVTESAKSLADTLRPDTHGMRVVHAPPLWNSEPLSEYVSDDVWNATDDPTVTGVALVVHGQPDAWKQAHATFDAHENSFVNRVRMSLVDRGIPSTNIRICFMEWQTPDVTETVRHLAALGCHRVLVSPACCPFDNATTRLDLQVAIKQARADEHVSTVILNPWGTTDIASEEITKAIRTTIDED